MSDFSTGRNLCLAFGVVDESHMNDTIDETIDEDWTVSVEIDRLTIDDLLKELANVSLRVSVRLSY